jgi:hypothetical protein
MKKLSKKHIVNAKITHLLNKDFVILTSKKLIPDLLLYKKGLLKFILPGNITNYKKKFFNYTLIDFNLNSLNILTYIDYNIKVFVFKNEVFKNNLDIFRFKIKNLHFEYFCKIYSLNIFKIFIFLNIQIYLNKSGLKLTPTKLNNKIKNNDN